MQLSEDLREQLIDAILISNNEDSFEKSINTVDNLYHIRLVKLTLFELLREKYPTEEMSFNTLFGIIFRKKLQNSETLTVLKNKMDVTDTAISRLKYFEATLKTIIEPNKIDGRNVLDSYTQCRTIVLDYKRPFKSHYDNWNLENTYYEDLYTKIKYNTKEAEDREGVELDFEISDFLESSKEDNIRIIVSPFGNGKSTLSKYLFRQLVDNYLNDSMRGQNFIPIYLDLSKGLSNTYLDYTFKQLLENTIKPQSENLIIIADALDEYGDNKRVLLEELDAVMSDYSALSEGITSARIVTYKKIITTRPLLNLPQELEDKGIVPIRKFVRVLPFTEEETEQYFQKYFENSEFANHTAGGFYKNLEFEYFSNMYLKEDLFRKPLFCWIFAVTFHNSENNRLFVSMPGRITEALMYSLFIHTILKGKHDDMDQHSIYYEKWILRKLALLKSVSPNISLDQMLKCLQDFALNEDSEDLKKYLTDSNLDLKNKIKPIIDSYFKSGQNNESIEFLHQSFQEYLLAEYYIECVLMDKRDRLRMPIPSEVTVNFFESLLDLIRLSFDIDKGSVITNHVTKVLNSTFFDIKNQTFDTTLLVMHARKLFKESAVELQNNSNTIETKKLLENDSPHFDNLVPVIISLFIYNKLSEYANLGENSGDRLKGFREMFSNPDFSRIPDRLKQFADLDLSYLNLQNVIVSRSNFSSSNLAYTNLSNSDLSDCNLLNSNLTFSNLTNANLSRSKMIYANLSNANLSNANLSNANLSNANLSHSNLSDAIITVTHSDDYDKFHDSYLNSGDLTGNISNVDFSFANLYNTNFSGSDSSNSNFQGVNRDIKLQNQGSTNENTEIKLQKVLDSLYTLKQFNENGSKSSIILNLDSYPSLDNLVRDCIEKGNKVYKDNLDSKFWLLSISSVKESQVKSPKSDTGHKSGSPF